MRSPAGIILLVVYRIEKIQSTTISHGSLSSTVKKTIFKDGLNEMHDGFREK